MVVDALSRKYSLLPTSQVKVERFDVLKELYQGDPYFGKIWEKCEMRPYNQFILHEVYLFKTNCLCIPKYFL